MTAETLVKHSVALHALNELLQRRSQSGWEVSPQTVTVPGKGCTLLTAIGLTLASVAAVDLCIAILAGWVSIWQPVGVSLSSSNMEFECSGNIPADLSERLITQIETFGEADLRISFSR